MILVIGTPITIELNIAPNSELGLTQHNRNYQWRKCKLIERTDVYETSALHIKKPYKDTIYT